MSTTIISIILGIGGMLGWGIYDFLGGVFSKQIGSFKSLFWSQLAGLISILLLAFALKTTFDIPFLAIALSPLASIVYSAGYLFFFKGFEKGNVSIIAATMNLWAVFTMSFAFLFMGQRLSTTQTIGVFLILSGATLAAIDWKSINKQGFQLSLGVREAILGAFFFGVFWNISEIVSEEIGWLLSTILTKLGIIIFLLGFSLFAKQEIGLTNIPTKTKYAVLLMGIIEVSAVALVNYGLTIGDAILITPIASALSIVTIALAVIFLKDKLSKLQLIGVVIAILGIVATAF
ncbi:MAG: DMT family transporter [Anaerolineales bacterium]|uniref:DMT family transporter n=1 Tax=Candidatus Villigracilis vicinus TaxID=3140679 RepID=UPI00313521C9|nr:DMT family transporter [Anaerolineales bacterium]MBK9781883.1 DMT family transporter [Anaerolineales bacterium]